MRVRLVTHRPGREIRPLTGLRGAAAAIVVLYHATNEFTATHPGPIGPGYLAVDLFFMLSGFVLALTYAGPRQPGWFRGFAWRRFARIYPLYAVLTLFCFVAACVVGSAPVATLASNLLLLQQTGVARLSPALGRSLVDPAWSISAEAVAYLLFPALVRVTLRTKPAAAAGWACGCAALLCWAAWTRPGLWGLLDLHDPRDAGALCRCLAEFSLGLLAFRLWQGWPPAAAVARRCEGPVWVLLLLCWFLRLDLAVVSLFPAVLLACCVPASRTARILGTRPLHELGVVSYALYLVHGPAIPHAPGLARALAAGGIPFAVPLTVALVCLGSVAAAWLLFRWVERPARTWLSHARADGRSGA